MAAPQAWGGGGGVGLGFGACCEKTLCFEVNVFAEDGGEGAAGVVGDGFVFAEIGEDPGGFLDGWAVGIAAAEALEISIFRVIAGGVEFVAEAVPEGFSAACEVFSPREDGGHFLAE